MLGEGQSLETRQSKAVRVTAIYLSPFSEITRLERETLILNGATLRELVGALTQKHGARFPEALIDPHTGSILPGMAVLVNGWRLNPDSRLEDSDEVVFVMAIAGG